jgi:hypothetical protein
LLNIILARIRQSTIGVTVQQFSSTVAISHYV